MRKKRPDPAVARRLDRAASLLADESLRRLEGRWIASMRDALGWSASALASKLGVTRQALVHLQAQEAKGAISLRRLNEVAAAMNCRVVYGFVADESTAALAADLLQRQTEARRRHRPMPGPT